MHDIHDIMTFLWFDLCSIWLLSCADLSHRSRVSSPPTFLLALATVWQWNTMIHAPLKPIPPLWSWKSLMRKVEKRRTPLLHNPCSKSMHVNCGFWPSICKWDMSVLFTLCDLWGFTPNRCKIPCCHGCAFDLLVRDLCAQATKSSWNVTSVHTLCGTHIGIR